MSNSNGHASKDRSNVKFNDAVSSNRKQRTWYYKVGSRLLRPVYVALFAPLVLAGAGLVVSASSESGGTTPDAPRALPVRTVSVQPVKSYRAAREYTGAIVARRTAELGFELDGKLESIAVEEGARVTQGAKLATIDTERLVTKRRELVARHAGATARLAEMIAGPRQEDIDAARSRVAALEANVELLVLQSERRKRLVAQQAASQDDYEKFVFDTKARKAELNEARHNLEELLNGTRKEQIEAQQAVVQQLDAAIAQIDVEVKKSTLRAPFAGTIARRLADEGTVMQAGQPILRLVEDRALEAWIGLPVHAAAGLAVGERRQVKIAGHFIDAVIAGRFPEVDPATRTRTVVLKLDDAAAANIVHGQVVRLQVEETVDAEGYWLPATALAKGSRGLWTSYVVVDDGSNVGEHLYKVERRDVEVLYTGSERVLVRGTLRPGDQVIRGGTHRVVPGQFVKVVTERNLPSSVSRHDRRATKLPGSERKTDV